jgi:dTDP-glucose 4,6-dehydratase
MRHGLSTDLDENLVRTHDIWESVRGARFFVTGGSGFFGRWLLESLIHANEALSLGISATVLSRSPEAFAARSPRLFRSPVLEFQRGDVRSFPSPAGRFDHVLHVATVPTPPANESTVRTTILEGTARTLEFAREAGATRFLFVSSGIVYGRQPAAVLKVPERSTLSADLSVAESANGTAKRAAETMATEVGTRSGFTTIIARGFSFLGPYLPLDGQFAAGNFIRDALSGGPIIVEGDGTPIRSYLYAADLAAWLWTIHLRGRHGRAYNVGGESSLSVLELAKAIAEAFVPVPEVVVAGKLVPGQVAERYVPCTRLAREDLGLRAWTSLPEAIRRTVAWHRTGST